MGVRLLTVSPNGPALEVNGSNDEMNGSNDIRGRDVESHARFACLVFVFIHPQLLEKWSTSRVRCVRLTDF